VEEAEYDVLTAKVFESWLIFKFNEVGYIFFVGPPRSGKTRGLETMATLCFNPKFAGYMTKSAVYRTLHNEWCTLFLDELQQYLKENRATFMAILNAGQRRGQEAIISVPRGRDWVSTGFKVFSSKFLASTEDTAKALATRCIIIVMVKNARSVPLRIDKVWAEKLRGKLNQYASMTGGQTLPDVEHIFKEKGFKDYRNIETFINLVTVTPPLYRKRIIEYAKQIDDQIAEEEGLNFYAELYKAVEFGYKNAKDGKIAVAAVTEIYNDGRNEQDKLTNQSVGAHLKVMGLRRVCRMPGGRMGRHVSGKWMKRLKRRYGPLPPPQKKIDEPSEPSEAKGGYVATHELVTPYPPSGSLDSLPSRICADCRKVLKEGHGKALNFNTILCYKCYSKRRGA
jgi:hypothetical protein